MNDTIAILYISSYPNIILLRPVRDAYTIVAVKDLSPDNFSSEFLDILEFAKELHVVYPAEICNAPSEQDIITNQFSSGEKQYQTVIYNRDLNSLFRCCKYYGVSTIKIYDFCKTMGSLLPMDLTLLLSDFQKNMHLCALYSNRKLLGFRSIVDMQVKYVKPLCLNYNINNITTSYDISLVKHLYSKFTNIDTLTEEVQSCIVPSIATLQADPIQTWEFKNNEYVLKTKNSDKQVPKLNKINLPKFKPFKLGFNLPKLEVKPNKLSDLLISALGLVLSATLAFSLVANKTLTDKVSYLTDKEAEFRVLLDDREETLAYFQRHVSALTNGEENPDNALYKALSAIKPDGPLGGITIDRESVVILFYLKEENESDNLDSYLQQLADTKLVVNPVVKTTSTVTYSDVNLRQYVVMFDRV